MKAVRLDKTNIDSYLTETYGHDMFYQYGGKVIPNIEPFQQNNFDILPLFIKPIMKQKTYSRYGKGIGFNFFTIKRQLDYNNLVILSVVNDGRSFYKSQSIVIIGYTAYKINGKMVYILAAYDNQCKEISYIDYNKLSILSSINYYAPVAQLDRATDF